MKFCVARKYHVCGQERVSLGIRLYMKNKETNKQTKTNRKGPCKACHANKL